MTHLDVWPIIKRATPGPKSHYVISFREYFDSSSPEKWIFTTVLYQTSFFLFFLTSRMFSNKIYTSLLSKLNF